MLRSIAGLVGAAVLLSGCAPFRDVAPEPEPTTAFHETLLPVAALPVDLLLRQRIRIRWSEREESFEAVLQKQGAQLLLLGLGPMNAVGFSLTLDDAGVRFENRSGRDLPFEPERILADVQRVFYPWVESGRASDCRNCLRQTTRAGFDVAEEVGEEFLERRRFRVAREGEGVPGSRATDEAEIVVRYEGWHEGGRVPIRAVLANGFYGYELTADTTSVEILSSD